MNTINSDFDDREIKKENFVGLQNEVLTDL